MPMGLKNSPSIFQRVMDDVLRKHIGNICHVYIDDIIVYGKNLEDHGKNLETILSELTNANFKLQPDKSEFFMTQVTFLGSTVSKEGIKPYTDEIIALRDFPEPKKFKRFKIFFRSI